MYGHHDARYNAEQILRNLMLIQDHYSSDPCADCLTKHWNLVMAYAEEGLTLDNYKKVADLLNGALEVGHRHFKVIVDCAVGGQCRVKKQEDLMKMLQEVRSLRKEISVRIYGLVGDVTHDAFDRHEAHDNGEHEDIHTLDKRHSHIHDHTKATGEELPDHIPLEEHLQV
jgi:hypothetical protein